MLFLPLVWCCVVYEHRKLPCSELVMGIHGSYKVEYRPNGPGTDEVLTADFTPPFKRLKMFDELERILKTKLPDPKDLSTPGWPAPFLCFEVYRIEIILHIALKCVINGKL